MANLNQKKGKKILCPELNLSWTDTFMLLGISFQTELETMTELNYNAKVTAIEKKIKVIENIDCHLLEKSQSLKHLLFQN